MRVCLMESKDSVTGAEYAGGSVEGVEVTEAMG